MTIEDWRSEINAIDDELLRLLNRRAQLASQGWAVKEARGHSSLRPQRGNRRSSSERVALNHGAAESCARELL